jgi:hypothetical protein
MRTFIRAFESSPVHCLKPRPSGNLRRPANGGAAAMLKKNYENLYDQHEMNIPLVDIIQNCFAWCARILSAYILCYPINEMIFKCPLDELV